LADAEKGGDAGKPGKDGKKAAGSQQDGKAGRRGGQGKPPRADGDTVPPKPPPKEKDTESKCRQRLRELGSLKTECKSWPNVLDSAEEMPLVKEALKQQMTSFIDKLQCQYDKVENAVVAKVGEDNLQKTLAEAEAVIQAYAKASDYCRKMQPKAKAKAKAKSKAKAKAADQSGSNNV
jgi:hypothetical protein